MSAQHKESHEHYFIVYRIGNGRKLRCGYYRMDYLKSTGMLLDRTVVHAEGATIPAGYEENEDYLYEVKPLKSDDTQIQ